MSDTISGIDFNAMVQGFYNTVLNIQQTATKTVGLDTLWMRAIPYENSEDVIINEYTLLNVSCPVAIKVITTNNNYDPAAFTIDAFGLNYDAPLEITVDRITWNETFGSDTIPQKGDIVFLKILNKLFEVSSSTAVYGFAELPTGYKMQLVKYNPTASRRESEEIRKNIEELTVAQETLFGKEISDEITDITDPMEMGLHNTAPMDMNKTYDADAIVVEDFTENGVIISRSYYDFSIAEKLPDLKQDIRYEIPDTIMISLWFSLNIQDLSSSISIINIREKTAKKWSLVCETTANLNEGDVVSLSRGNLLYMDATVKEIDGKFVLLEISTASAAAATKKLTNWSATTGWKISQKTEQTILSSSDIGMTVSTNECVIRLGKRRYSFNIKNLVSPKIWRYISLIIDNTEITLYTRSAGDKKFTTFSEKRIKPTVLDCSNPTLGRLGDDLYIRNFRMYKPLETVDENIIMMDSQSEYSENASQLETAFGPGIPVDAPYFGEAR